MRAKGASDTRMNSYILVKNGRYYCCKGDGICAKVAYSIETQSNVDDEFNCKARQQARGKINGKERTRDRDRERGVEA